jgi:prophage antirepressor-like protein
MCLVANEDMEGVFLGGGALEHVVSEGEIYLRADQMATLLGQTGTRMALSSIRENSTELAGTANFLIIVSEKLYELRSELLKREAERLFWPADFED